jgi:hypothetical protein
LVGQSFERFKKEVEAWDMSNKDPPFTKYPDLIESLKKNSEVKEYIISGVLDNMADVENKTVEKSLLLLKDKYAKTTTEKSQEILKDILHFKMKKGETCEKFWDRFQYMVVDCQREKINAKFFYLLGINMVEKASENGQINAEWERLLRDSMEIPAGADRIRKAETDVTDGLKRELKKLKIENNRDQDLKKGKEDTNVHYGEN